MAKTIKHTLVHRLEENVLLCALMLAALLELVDNVDCADVRVLFLHLHDGLDDAEDNGVANPSSHLLVSLSHGVVMCMLRCVCVCVCGMQREGWMGER